MPDILIPVDLRHPPESQSPRPHNRWHPEIPPVAAVEPEVTVRVECLDVTGGQILNTDSADDVRQLDLDQLPYLSGPVEIVGARPGDLLVVNVLDIGPLPGAEWGYTLILDRSAWPGLLAEEYPEARKAVWDLNGVFATSRHIEGVRITGSPHPGVIGCAPAPESLPRVARVGPEAGALVGGVPAPELARVIREATSVWTARENGGSFNMREFTRGARAYLPVFVPGALLSVGDLQFSQGDGRVTALGGIKMSGWIDLSIELVPDGMRRYGISRPTLQPGPVEPHYCDFLTFHGFGEDGGTSAGDVRTAFASACQQAIRYLERLGYTGEQGYALLAAAPTDGRIGSLLDPPNVCCTLALPLDVFEMELRPGPEPVAAIPRGGLARPS